MFQRCVAQKPDRDSHIPTPNTPNQTGTEIVSCRSLEFRNTENMERRWKKWKCESLFFKRNMKSMDRRESMDPMDPMAAPPMMAWWHVDSRQCHLVFFFVGFGFVFPRSQLCQSWTTQRSASPVASSLREAWRPPELTDLNRSTNEFRENVRQHEMTPSLEIMHDTALWIRRSSGKAAESLKVRDLHRPTIWHLISRPKCAECPWHVQPTTLQVGSQAFAQRWERKSCMPWPGYEFGALQAMRKYQKSQEIIRIHKQS